MTRLDANNLPKALRKLIPQAEIWGTGDDYEREKNIEGATRNELQDLIHCIDEVSDEELYGWLSGVESYNPNPTEEYIAMSNLTMAIDLAKIRVNELEKN